MACKALEASSTRVLDRALASSEELRGEPVPDLSRTPRGCLEGGPWAIEVESATATPCQGSCARLRWRLVHVSNGGEVARGPSEDDRVGARGLRLGAVSFFDWDGDGEPEAFLRRGRASFGCGREGDPLDERGGIWTFHAGQVTPYEPARRAVGEGAGPQAVRDADGDGRPDLLSAGPFRAVVELACGTAGGTALLEGPELLARSRPDGGFAPDDEAAQAYLRRACPSAPSSLVLPSPKAALVLGATARNLACARAWGVSTERLREELEAGRAQLCPGEAGACAALVELKRWAGLPAPVRLGQLEGLLHVFYTDFLRPFYGRIPIS